MEQPIRRASLLVFSFFVALPTLAQADHHPSTWKAGYDDGVFVGSADDAYRLQMNILLQAGFYTTTRIDGDSQQSFDVPQIRLGWSGNAFGPDLTYQVQMSAFGVFLDYNMNYKFADGRFQVRAGGQKVRFQRTGMSDIRNHALMARPAHIFMDADPRMGWRDIGVTFHNGTEGSLEWAVGLFNGPTGYSPLLVGRIGYNHGGIDGYTEADLTGGGFRFAVAASAFIDFQHEDDTSSGSAANVDYIVKVAGFSSTGGFTARMAQDGSGMLDASLAQYMFHVQAGYTLDQRFLLAARFGMDMNDSAAVRDRTSVSGGFTWLLHGHNVKWLTEAGAHLDEQSGVDTTDVFVRTQLSLAI